MRWGLRSTEKDDSLSQSSTFSLRVLLIVRVLRSTAAGVINLAFPYLILVRLHMNDLLLGSIYAVAVIATALLSILFGFVADLISRKFAYIISLALLPISALLIYWFQTLPVLFLAAVVGGYSATGALSSGGVGAVVQGPQSAIISDLTSRVDRTFYYSLVAFLSGFSGALGVFLAGLFTLSGDFAIAFILSALSTFTALLMRIGRISQGGTIRMRTGKVIGKFSLTGLFFGVSNGLITPFLIPFFILVYGIPRNQMSQYAALSGLIASTLMFMAPRIERTLGFLRGVITARGLSAALAVAFPLLRLLPISLAIYLIFPALRAVTVPVVRSAMTDMIHESERARAFSIQQSARLMATGGGTAFTGYELETPYLAAPFFIYAIIICMNLYLYHRFFSNYKPPEELLNPENVEG